MATADPKSAAHEKLEKLAAHWAAKLSLRPIVVGLSGGPDSTLLLALCAAIHALNPKLEARAVHCIHGLDDDDPYWLAHCRMLCQKLKLPLKVKKLNIVYQNRISPEDSSRKERYRALLEECQDCTLFLGHQKDDKTESFFLALKRGSGPHGLSGMQELTVDQRGTIVRPLLGLTKAEIEQMLNALDLAFVFDISNTYLKFERNFLRLQVLPLIKTRFRAIDKAVARTQELCALEHDLALRFIEEIFKERYNAAEDSLSCRGLDLSDEHLLLMLLRRFCQTCLELPPELGLLKEAVQLLRSENGRSGLIELIPNKLSLRRFRDKLYLVENMRCPQGGVLPLRPGQKLIYADFCYALLPAAQTELSGAGDAADGTEALPRLSLSADDTLYLHFALPAATRLQPQGREHSRELKKLYTEYDIPSWERAALPVLSLSAKRTVSSAYLGLAAAFGCRQTADSTRGQWILQVKNLKTGRLLNFSRGRKASGQ